MYTCQTSTIWSISIRILPSIGQGPKNFVILQQNFVYLLDQDHKITTFLTTSAGTIGPGQQVSGIFNYNFVYKILLKYHKILLSSSNSCQILLKMLHMVLVHIFDILGKVKILEQKKRTSLSKAQTCNPLDRTLMLKQERYYCLYKINKSQDDYVNEFTFVRLGPFGAFQAEFIQALDQDQKI